MLVDLYDEKLAKAEAELAQAISRLAAVVNRAAALRASLRLPPADTSTLAHPSEGRKSLPDILAVAAHKSRAGRAYLDATIELLKKKSDEDDWNRVRSEFSARETQERVKVWFVYLALWAIATAFFVALIFGSAWAGYHAERGQSIGAGLAFLGSCLVYPLSILGAIVTLVATLICLVGWIRAAVVSSSQRNEYQGLKNRFDGYQAAIGELKALKDSLS